MQDVPKSVLRGLRKRATAEAHPDANLLTAFAERSLPERERARVMDHLARCRDCREVIALALPATEGIAATDSGRQVRSSWLAWPVLRWGVALAGIVVMTSVGIVQYRHRSERDKTVALSTAAHNERALTAEQTLSPSPVASKPRVATGQTESGKQTETRKKAFTAPVVAASDESVRSSNPLSPMRDAFQGAQTGTGMGRGMGTGSVAGARAEAPTVNGNPAAELPATTESVTVQAAPETNTASGEISNQHVANQPDQGLQDKSSKGSGSDEIEENPAVAQRAPGGVVSGEASATVATPSATPRWNISAGGALQRSLDSGRNWEDVNPRASAGGSVAGGMVGNTRETHKEKVATGRSPVFRAVAALGSEVWAGGSGAMLYHSGDSGTHWLRVVPSASGTELTGDVISIEFSDEQHGKIATSTGEHWATSDDGQTWSRQ